MGNNNIEYLERFRGITNPINNINNSDQRTLKPIDQVNMELQIMAKDRQLYGALSGRNLLYRPDLQLHIDPTFGQSKYDYAAKSIVDMSDLTDLRASEQSQWAKLGNSLFKTAGRTVTSAVEALSFVPGAIRALVPTQEQKLEGDNWWSRWMQNSINSAAFSAMMDLEDKMERIFPNYRSYKEQDTNWLTRMVTPQYMIDFWFDDIFKNIGFSWGTLLGTRAFLKGTTFAGRQVGNAGRRTIQALSKLKNQTAERNVRRLTVKQLSHELGKPITMNELRTLLDNAATPNSVKEVANELLRRQKNLGIFEAMTGSVISAGSEAHYESVLAAKSIMDEQKKRLDQWYANPDNENYLRQMYSNYVNDTLTPMTFDQYKQYVYDESLMEIQDGANKAAGLIMAFELPLLSLTTWITFRRFFNSGYHSHAIGRNWNKVNELGSDFNDWKLKSMFKAVRDKSGKLIGLETNFKKSDKLLAFLPIVSEGAEEMGQRFISSAATFGTGAKFNNYFSQYYDDIFNDNYKAEANILLNSLTYGAKNTFLESEGWLEGFSGAVLGVLGGINFRKSNLQSKLHNVRNQETGNTDESDTQEAKDKSLLEKLKQKISQLPKPNFEGGVRSRLKTLNNAEKLVQQCVDYVNDIVNNETNRERVQNLLRTLAINERMAKAIENSDAKLFKDAELEELVTIIRNFDLLGQREFLNQLLDEVESTEKKSNRLAILQEFEERKSDLKPEDQNLGADDFIARVVKEVKSWRNALDEYTQHYKIVDQFLGDVVSDQTKHMIASLGTAAKDREIRLQELYQTIAKKLAIQDSTLSIDDIIDGKTNIPGLQQILNGFNDTIIQYKKENPNAENDEELIKKLSAYLNNELIKIIPNNNFDPNTISDIIDFYNLYAEYVSLTNQYKSLLVNKEAIAQLDRINTDIKNTDIQVEDEQEQSNGQLSELGLSGETKQAKQLTFVNNVSKFAETLSKKANLPSNINVDETLDKLQNANSLDEVRDIINTFGDTLVYNLNKFSPEDEIYKQTSELYNAWSNLFAYTGTDVNITDYLQKRNTLVNEFRNKILKLIDEHESLKTAIKKNKTKIDSAGRFLVDLFNVDNMRMSLVQDPILNEKYIEIQIENVIFKMTISNAFEIKAGTASGIKLQPEFKPVEDPKTVTVGSDRIFEFVCDELSQLGILTDELKTQIQKVFDDAFKTIDVNGHAQLQSTEREESQIFVPLNKKNIGGTDENVALRDEIYKLAAELRANLANITSSSTTTSPTTIPSVTTALETTPSQEKEDGSQNNNPETPVSPEEPTPEPTPEVTEEPAAEQQPETVPESASPESPSPTINPVERNRKVPGSLGANTLPFKVYFEQTYTYSTAITEHDLAIINPNPSIISDNYVRQQLQRWADGTDKLIDGEPISEDRRSYIRLLLKLQDKMDKMGTYRYINTHYFPTGTQVRFKKPEDDSLKEGTYEAIEVVVITSENGKTSEHTIGYITINNTHFYVITQSGIDSNGYYNIKGTINQCTNGQEYKKPYTSEESPSVGMSMKELENDIDRTDNHFYGFINSNGEFIAQQPQDMDSAVFNSLIKKLTEAYKNQEGVGRNLRKGVPMVIVSRKAQAVTDELSDYTIQQIQPQKWNAGNTQQLEKVRRLAEKIVDLVDIDDEQQFIQTTKRINQILKDNFVFYIDQEKGELSETGFFRVLLQREGSIVVGVHRWVKNERTGKFEAKLVEYTADDKKKTDWCWVWSGSRSREDAINKTTNFLFNLASDPQMPFKHSTPVQSITEKALEGKALDFDGNERGVKEMVKEGSVKLFNALSPYNCGIKFDIDDNFQKEIVEAPTEKQDKTKASEKTQIKQIEDTPMETPIENDDNVFLEDLQDRLKGVLQNQPVVKNLKATFKSLEKFVQQNLISKEDLQRYKQIKNSRANQKPNIKDNCSN